MRAVWRLVDEYALAESERATLKLLRGLDKHMQHLQSSAAPPPTAAKASAAAPEGAAMLPAALTAPTSQPQAQSSHAHQMVQEPEGVQRLGAPAQQDMLMPSYIQLQHGRAEPTSAGTKPDSGSATHSRHPLAVETGGQCSNVATPVSASEQQALSQPSHQQALHQHVGPSAVPLTASASQTTFSPECQQQAGRVQVPHAAHLHRMAADPRRTVTADQVAYPTVSSTAGWSTLSATPLAPPLLVRASGNGRKGKLEYRLSQDDIYIPNAAELAAVMQQPGRTAPRWTADVYTHSQHGRSNYPLQRPSADMRTQQHQREIANQQGPGTVGVSGNSSDSNRLQQSGLQQSGWQEAELQQDGHQQNGLQQYTLHKQAAQTAAVPVIANVSLGTATHSVFMNPLTGQNAHQGQQHSQGQLQHHGQGPRQPNLQGQFQQPYQLPHQQSNMVSLMQKADAAQVCF